jgi:hypothetical protein
MSELINTPAGNENRRWRLLAGVSALALLASVPMTGAAKANEDDRPIFWVELGGQLEHVSQPQGRFDAPFEYGQSVGELQELPKWPLFGYTRVDSPDGPFDRARPFNLQTPPRFMISGEGRVLFQPSGTDWSFNASVRYGRATGHRNEINATGTATQAFKTPPIYRFTNGDVDYRQSYMVLDFQVGKDVGLGLFGGANSTINAGVRFAQFSSRSSIKILANGAIEPYTFHSSYFDKYYRRNRFQTYILDGHATRSFHGIGPSLSWNVSTPIAGHPDSMQIMLDWGLNGALLFGRQRAQVEHKTTATDAYQYWAYGKVVPRAPIYNHANATARSRSVTIPNIGAFAGLSMKFPNAKVSLGYRADFFFGAMDSGIDQHRTQDMSFHGPFAKVSVGL